MNQHHHCDHEKQPLLNNQAPVYGAPVYGAPVYGSPVVVVQQQSDSSHTQLILFLVGLFFPFSWLIGGFLIGASNPSEMKWKRINRVLSFIIIALTVISGVIVGIIFAVAANQHSQLPAPSPSPGRVPGPIDFPPMPDHLREMCRFGRCCWCVNSQCQFLDHLRVIRLGDKPSCDRWLKF